MRLNSELFSIPDEGAYLVYAPLRRMVFRADAEIVNILAALQEGQPQQEVVSHPVLETLRTCGIIDGPTEQKPAVLAPTRYKPTRVTLFLTSRCNLACRYCYADANDETLDLKEHVGRAAIDYVARNCREFGEKNLNVGFHGGGEPTVAWRVLQTLTAYAKEAATNNGLKLSTGISTNGCFNLSRARWLAENLSFVSLSIDGFPKLQNSQRPFPTGAPSSPLVEAVTDFFDEVGFPYSIQSTITAETVREMPNAVLYFARRMHPRFLKFEPVSDAGRYATRRSLIPDMREFAEWYDRAYEVAEQEGIKLSFSGIRLWGASVSYFCGAFIEPFTITPDGYVTACYEVCSKTKPFNEVFIIGRYDDKMGDFVIDMDRLARLRMRNVDNLEPCKNCFCKYSCGGDCATRNFRISGSEELGLVGARCEAIREITRFRLRNYVASAAARAHAKAPEVRIQ